MKYIGAGGTSGGTSRFFMGLLMMVVGGFLFFNSINVTYGFGMGHAIHSFGSFQLTTGMTLFPFIFGIGLIFYNAKNPLGWILSIAALAMLGFGIISSIKFQLRGMTAFELISILVLMIGGIGLFLSALRDYEQS